MPTKQELIAAIRRSQERVAATFGSLSQKQLATRVHDDEGDHWTARDALAHLASRWLGYQRLLHVIHTGAVAPRPAGFDINQWNRQRVEERQTKSPAELLQEFRQVHDEMIRQVEAMPEEALSIMVEGPGGRVTLGEQLLAVCSQHSLNHTAVVEKALGLESR